MNIIVVDDHVAAEEIVRGALASEGHSVRGIRTPDELEHIGDLEKYALAFVDLRFHTWSENSGLLALRLLDEAGVPALIYSADEEDNRLLFLLAAFQFYEPLALVPKSASSADIRAIICTIGSGARPDTAAARRYKPPRPGVPLLNRLIVRLGDLPLWQAIAEHTDRFAIAEAVQMSRSKVDDFLAEHFDIVGEIEETFGLRTPPQPLYGAPQGRTNAARSYAHRMPPLHSFAVVHRDFFQDPEVEKLIEQRDNPPTRRRR
ncbi:MAG TPA: hypothetical protein VKU39_13330 [Streptosporangiaceae bacterium]|nr:hypothetical protein [Streptosporangiaceae bacterium]